MMKKKPLYLQVILFIFFIVIFSSVSYASPNNNKEKESYLEHFNLKEDYLFGKVNNDNVKEDVNDFKHLQLVQGFSRYYMSTFSSQRLLVGQGEPGTEVGVIVYTIRNNTIEVQQKPTIDVIGASGIYNRMITYNNIGENHVVISVKRGREVIVKHYIVNRKAEETKNKLELLDVKLFTLNF